MTFEEQAAELHQLEAVAKCLGISEGHFERIALAVTAEGAASDHAPRQQLDEIRRRVHAAAEASSPRRGETH